MRAIPYAGTAAFERLARRTSLVRAALAVALVMLVVLAALAILRPRASEQPILAPQSGGVVVLDLSASITQDTYSRIHETLPSLVARDGRAGRGGFSNVAYDAP